MDAKFSTRGLFVMSFAVGLVAVPGPALAYAMSPRPDPPPRAPVVVERVEVPIPVDDADDEVIQMLGSAGGAALLAAWATKIRLRRRYEPPSPAAIIEIDWL
jgi:hypothetical protein